MLGWQFICPIVQAYYIENWRILGLFCCSPCISQRAAVVHYVDKGSILAKVRKIWWPLRFIKHVARMEMGQISHSREGSQLVWRLFLVVCSIMR